MGIEPTLSAWKAEVLPLNYTRVSPTVCLVEGEGFEPSKAEPADLQSAPFGHSGTPPATLVQSEQSAMPMHLSQQYSELVTGVEPATC